MKKQTGKKPTGKSACQRVEALEGRTLLSATGIIPQPVPLPPVPAPAPVGGANGLSASSLVLGPDTNIWFTDQNNNAIGRESPDGTVHEFPLPTDDAGPDQIVAAGDGNLWFIESYLDQIGRITPAGVVTEFPLPQDVSPGALTAGPGGIWFIDDGNNAIDRITPAGKVTPFPIDSTGLSLNDGITQGPDGNLWAVAVDDSGNGALLKITPTGKLSTVSLPAYPDALTAGPDGNLWVACDSEIERVTPGGSVTSFALPGDDGTFDIAPGPDGALWFATYGQNAMGRITTTGSVVEFDPPGLQQYGFVNALASGPDQKIWFATDSPVADSPVVSFDPHNALLAGGIDGTATAGTTSSLKVASFVDLAGSTDPSEFKATIDWGDQTTSNGAITPNNQGGFDITGSHLFSIGSSDVTVTITDVRPASADPGGLAGRTTTATANITSPAPPTQGTAVDINPTAGLLFSGVVAHYTGVLLNSLSSYSANINWGDGHYTSGTIAADGQGGVSISGSHRYAAQGSYSVSTNLWPWSFGPVLPIAAGGGGVGIVGRGTAIGLAGREIAANTGANVAVPGSPPIAIGPIGITPIVGGDGTSGTATVAAGAMDGTGYTLLASKGALNNIVASFKLSDPATDLSHLHATVKWSDGDTFDWYRALVPDVTDAPITSDGQGGFTVSAAASFPQFGWFHYQVLISDDRLGTTDASIVGAAYGQVIANSPIRPIPVDIGIISNAGGGVASSSAVTAPSSPALSERVKFSAVTIQHPAGSAFTGKVAVLTGLAKGTGASDLSGTIDWGDGSTSTAQFAVGKKGKILVRGTHTYLDSGKKALSISLTQSLGGSASGESSPPLQLPRAQGAAHISRGHHRSHARRN